MSAGAPAALKLSWSRYLSGSQAFTPAARAKCCGLDSLRHQRRNYAHGRARRRQVCVALTSTCSYIQQQGKSGTLAHALQR